MKPNKVFIFIVAIMACLAVLCIALPGRIILDGQELRWPTLAEVIGIKENDTVDLIVNVDTVEFPIYIEDTSSTVLTEPQPVVPKIVVDSTTDSRIFLHSFYQALAQAENHKVRVMHYGDSQIEEDRMTQEIRDALQAKYGGTGVGLMPLAQTIPSLTVRQELRLNGRYVNPHHGPQRYVVYGPKSGQRTDGLYGPMGQMAVMNDSLVDGSEKILTICTPKDKHKQYEQWQIFADNTIHYSISGDTIELLGRGNVYGLSQESNTGVIVDNIPMRGCLGLVFTKIDSSQLASFYQDQHVRLIILQFGGNAIPSNKNPGTIQGIVKGLREQVRFLQTCAPNASILFIGPSDMLTQTDGEWTTYPMVPYMDKLLRKMALEENIAYFSLFRWMGGAGSMARWQEIGLAGSDGVHFMRSGARKAGKAVAEWIIQGASTTTAEEKIENNE